MPFEANNGLGGVSNYYGPRDTGGSVGSEETDQSIRQYSIAFTGASLNSSFLPPVVLPRGAKQLRATLRVDEAFVLTGTAPTVIFGGTAPATNGIVLTQAELQAIGTKTPASTGTGTWAVASATGTTAAERITRALGGTTPAVSPTVGKATLIIEFINKTKV
jgi:hypothetical protein